MDKFLQPALKQNLSQATAQNQAEPQVPRIERKFNKNNQPQYQQPPPQQQNWSQQYPQQNLQYGYGQNQFQEPYVQDYEPPLLQQKSNQRPPYPQQNSQQNPVGYNQQSEDYYYQQNYNQPAPNLGYNQPPYGQKQNPPLNQYQGPPPQKVNQLPPQGFTQPQPPQGFVQPQPPQKGNQPPLLGFTQSKPPQKVNQPPPQGFAQTQPPQKLNQPPAQQRNQPGSQSINQDQYYQQYNQPYQYQQQQQRQGIPQQGYNQQGLTPKQIYEQERNKSQNKSMKGYQEPAYDYYQDPQNQYQQQYLQEAQQKNYPPQFQNNRQGANVPLQKNPSQLPPPQQQVMTVSEKDLEKADQLLSQQPFPQIFSKISFALQKRNINLQQVTYILDPDNYGACFPYDFWTFLVENLNVQKEGIMKSQQLNQLMEIFSFNHEDTIHYQYFLSKVKDFNKPLSSKKRNLEQEQTQKAYKQIASFSIQKGLTKMKIDQIFKQGDQYNQGKMSSQEFKKAMKQIVPNDFDSEELNKIIFEYDKYNDGLVYYAEFLTKLYSFITKQNEADKLVDRLKLHCQKDRINLLKEFQSLDTQDTQKVTQQDFEFLLQKIKFNINPQERNNLASFFSEEQGWIDYQKLTEKVDPQENQASSQEDEIAQELLGQLQKVILDQNYEPSEV